MRVVDDVMPTDECDGTWNANAGARQARRRNGEEETIGSTEQVDVSC